MSEGKYDGWNARPVDVLIFPTAVAIEVVKSCGIRAEPDHIVTSDPSLPYHYKPDLTSDVLRASVSGGLNSWFMSCLLM